MRCPVGLRSGDSSPCCSHRRSVEGLVPVSCAAWVIPNSGMLLRDGLCTAPGDAARRGKL
ncbi:Uncharacterised protein [Bordetella pertussis]|nr:Uncharacterised protein [Bordetella pertussis]